MFLGFLLLNLLTAVVFLQHISMLPIAMGQDGLSPSTFGWVIALNGVWLGAAGIAAVVAAGQILSGPSRERRVIALAVPEPTPKPEPVLAT